MSTEKNATVGFRDADNIQQRKSPALRSCRTKVAKATRLNDSVEDAFLKPMTKPWTSPHHNSGTNGAIQSTTASTVQMVSSTPLHLNGNAVLSASPVSATTTRQSLDLFNRNAALEPPSRLSLTTDFALSALKNSFSMSSLSQHCPPGTPPSVLHTPDVNARLKWERPFNSLTRLKERGVARIQWRRSFGSSPVASKEDVRTMNQPMPGSNGTACGPEDWPALQANYTYLMSCDLMESCRSLNGEMSWDNGDLDHLKLAPAAVHSPAADSDQSVAVGCQTDVEIAIPDLQIQLRLFREWLKRMEGKVPKLVIRQKWTKELVERLKNEFKVLHREIEGHSAEFSAIVKRCASTNPRLGNLLENRYHRLLLRILEWTCHLESLAEKLPLGNGRRAAVSSPESQVGLPCSKHRRLDHSPKNPDHIHQLSGQVEGRNGGEMRQSNAEGGLSPPLPVAAPVSRANMGIYEFKHPDTDTENGRALDHGSEEDVGSTRKRSGRSEIVRRAKSNESSENEWVYSPNTLGKVADHVDGSVVSVRKKLSFDSEEDDASSSKSWYQYSSSDSDWLQSGGLELEGSSDAEHPQQQQSIHLIQPSTADGSAGDGGDTAGDDQAVAAASESPYNKDAGNRVYDKEKVHKLVTEAEQMVSASGEACRNKKRKPGGRYSNPEAAGDNNSECDASSELTSDGEMDGGDKDDHKSASLNRTFHVYSGDNSALLGAEGASPVVMRNRQRIKAQRPWSLSGLGGLPSPTAYGDASARWMTASETALNCLSSPTLSHCPVDGRPLMCHASTQKDRLSPSTEGLGSSLAALSSSGSAGGVGGGRHRRRRHSARLRNLKSLGRRGELDVQLNPNGSDSNNATLQARLSMSAASASSSGEYSSGGTGSQRSRRVVKSNTLTHIPVDCNPPVSAVATSVVSPQSSPLKPAAPSTNSSPRSAPSDGELGLVHGDEASNFSEQAWDNYLDRYASEAYSEDPPDAESARRLLEFGEDYRNDLDSLSDCPSSLSNELRLHRPHYPHKRSPPKRGKGMALANRSVLTEMRLLDSDSDLEDLVHVVGTSSSQYTIALNTYYKALNSSRVDVSQYAELLATCRANIECLQTILTQFKRFESDLEDHVAPQNELKPIRDLIMKWEQLDAEVAPLLHEDVQQDKQLHQKMQGVKSKLLDLEKVTSSIGAGANFEEDLMKLRQIQHQVEAERKSLLQVNIDVHNCVAQRQQSCGDVESNLKDDVAGLYQTWDQLFKRVAEKEKELLEAEQMWNDIQKQLEELKAAITADQERVQSFIKQQASVQATSTQASSDTEASDPSKNSDWIENWKSTQVGNIQCDSGISSGSDGEFITIGEREKRLTVLKQLARKLESALSPGSAALVRINENLDQTEKELNLLQNHLSHLPPIPAKRSAKIAPPVKEMSVQTDPELVAKKKQRRISAVAAASGPRSALPQFWRILRAALPFHLAIVALIIAACVMEPSCCNYLNTFGSSLVPKLSYLGGPPPI